MIYIYDLIVNFNDELLNFYEWEENDSLTHVKKVLLFKVDHSFYKKVISNRIIVDKEFLNSIYKKCEYYEKKKVEIINYACVFTDGNDVIIVTFNENGKIIEKSKLLIDDELEIIEISNNLKIKNINYKNIKSNYKVELFRRNEKKVINLILSELKLIKNDEEKIKYLYYEWFDKKCDHNNIYNELVNDINSSFSEKHIEFLNILNLMVR